jgi:hypothetical protein
MPIDASIPLQAKGLQLESPVNQLVMMTEATKLGEMNRGIEEQNKLNEYLKSGADLASAEGRRGLINYGKTGLGYAKALNEQDISAANLKKTNLEIDDKKLGIMRERSKDLLQNTSNENFIAHTQENVRDGLITPQQGQQAIQNYTNIPPNQRVAFINQNLAKAEEVYKMNTVSANTKASLAQSAAQHADVQNRPQYIQTDAGLVAVPNVLKPGQAPVGVPVMGANGENLGKPLKDIPATVNKAIIENDISMNKANRALDLLQGKNVTTPKGDVIKGSADATGFWKGLTPQVILNKWDPGGVSTRAFVADIGSLKVHDRSGAAVTASETPRLKPFIPSIYDAPDVAAEKLVNFKAEYEDIQRGLTETYSKEQGYRPSPLLTSGKSSGGGAKPSLDSIFNPNPKQ